MRNLIILAVVLRVLVALFLFHPDIKTYNYQVSFLKKGVVDIYSYLVENKKTLPLKEEFVYFPLTYLVLGGYQALISPVVGEGFDAWLANAETNSMARDPSIFFYLLILKLPYLALDLGIAYVLMQFFDKKENKLKAATVWLFNPFSLILIYVYSNVDIMPVFLTVLAFLAFKKEKMLWGAAALGVASGFKMYPLLFVPFLFLIGKSLKEKNLLTGIPVAIFALITLPFASNAFLQSALVSGLTTRIFNPGLTIGFNETIIVGLMGIFGLFFYSSLTDRKLSAFFYWLVIFLLLFAFSHFHIQWLLWIAPFVAIFVVKNPRYSWLVFFLSTLAFLIPFLYDDRSMTVGWYRVYSTLYDLLPTPFAVVEKFYDPYSLQSILHSIFAGGILVLLFKILRKETA